jgi:hypothetical protein
MKNTEIKTLFKREQEAKDIAIRAEFEELMSQPGAMATAVNQILMRKYGIHAASTIWTIRKRAQKLIAEQAATEK